MYFIFILFCMKQSNGNKKPVIIPDKIVQKQVKQHGFSKNKGSNHQAMIPVQSYQQKNIREISSDVLPEPHEDRDRLQGQSQFCPYTLQCYICSEAYKADELINFTQCSHEFCRKCAVQFARICIMEMKAIVCPSGCGASLQQQSKLFGLLQQKQIEAYKKAQFIRFTDREKLNRCSNADCHYGILIEHDNLQDRVAECHLCSFKFCTKCWWPHHRGDCSNAAESFIGNQLLFATCPGCKRNIERNQGCHHMTCVCTYQFCYYCLGKWSGDHQCTIQNQRAKKLLKRQPIQHYEHVDVREENFEERHNRAIQNFYRELEQRQQRIQQGQRLRQQQLEQRRRQIQQRQMQQAQARAELFRRRGEQERQRRERQIEQQRIQQQKREEQRVKGLQIMRQFKQKKNGKWRVDDDQFNELLKTTQPKRSSDMMLQNNGTKPNIQNNINHHQKLMNYQQKFKEIQRKESLKKQLKQQVSGNANSVLMKKIVGQNDGKRTQMEVKLQKMQVRKLQEQIARLEQIKQLQIRRQKKNARVAQSNNKFLSSHNIF